MTMDRHHRHFEEDLGMLKTRLLEMGGLAEERLQLSVRGLVERDLKPLEKVLTGDGDVNQLHIEIDDRCFKLLALQQPMAVDLRAIVGRSRSIRTSSGLAISR
jgi:phosphate transport system protein